MSTGADKGAQSPHTGTGTNDTDQKGGGNMVGGDGINSKLYQPPAFMGKSGQPDNQDTDRPKGST